MDSLHRAINRGIQRYLYDPEPTNDTPNEPIACLGQIYHTSAPAPSSSNESGLTERSQTIPWPRGFLNDVEARLWFTYRSGFPKIPKGIGQAQASPSEFGSNKLLSMTGRISHDGFTADTGFGCMVRSAQTLLANALLTLHLSRSWRRGDDVQGESRILRLFADDERAPFSIHRFMEHGAAACDKPAGQWFGPQAASQCIKALNQDQRSPQLAVYLADEQGGSIYADEVLKLAHASAADEDGEFDLVPDPDPPFKPILILVPSRLGHDKIHPRYHATLLSLFSLEQFAGIAGGRPASAHYFFAKQGQAVFFLDPHFPRPALPFIGENAVYSQEERDRAHTRRVRRMDLSEIDPSMLIGFLIRDLAAWQQFRQHLQLAEVLGKDSRALQVCCVMESRPSLSPSIEQKSPILSTRLHKKSTSYQHQHNGTRTGNGRLDLQRQSSLESNPSVSYTESSLADAGTSLDSGEMIGLPAEQDEDNFGVVSDEETSVTTSDDEAVDLGDVTVGNEQDDILSDEEGPQ